VFGLDLTKLTLCTLNMYLVLRHLYFVTRPLLLQLTVSNITIQCIIQGMCDFPTKECFSLGCLHIWHRKCMYTISGELHWTRGFEATSN